MDLRPVLVAIVAMPALLLGCSGGDDDDSAADDDAAEVDGDGDGFTRADGDCDDGDPAVYPGATEVCGDELDSDCSGDPDDGATDLDGDGSVDPACTGGDDCDDGSWYTHPGAFEACDGADNDCDGEVDEGLIEVVLGGPGLQAAIDAAADGDTLCVGPGNWRENLVFAGRHVRVEAVDGWGETTVDAGLDGSGASFVEGDTSQLVGFRVWHGTGTRADPDGNGATSLYGGGIHVQGASPVLADNKIHWNEADHGGGVYLGDSGAVLVGNEISGNTARYGGGLRLRECDGVTSLRDQVLDNVAEVGGGVAALGSVLEVREGVFEGNQASDVGGGVYGNSGSTVRVTDSTFSGNESATYGGGLRLHTADGTVSGCAFEGNTAPRGAGMAVYVGQVALEGSVFTANVADEMGGGLFAGSDTVVDVSGCAFEGNSAVEDGGGIRLYKGGMSLVDTVISGNQAGVGGGVACRLGELVVEGGAVEGNGPDDVVCDECDGCGE